MKEKIYIFYLNDYAGACEIKFVTTSKPNLLTYVGNLSSEQLQNTHIEVWENEEEIFYTEGAKEHKLEILE